MISQFIVKSFIKDNKNVKDKKVRGRYGLLAGIIGVILNLMLFIIKLSVGILTNSLAATVDAFNNLSDSASSIVTIFAFKIANKPADEEHPFGYGRIEYITALIVAFMVMLVGFEFVKTSIDKIFHPSKTIFKFIPFLLIIFSMLTKIWLSIFNKYVGEIIESSALKAASFEAFSDVAISGCIAISLVLSKYFSFELDGYLGIAVAIILLYSGFRMVKETLTPLLGAAPDAELVKKIKDNVMAYDNISGVHDIIIHNYGPDRWMASIHAEVPNNIDIVKIHNIIDKAEKEISEELNIYLVIHIDPIYVNDGEVLSIKKQLLKILKEFPLIKSIHDFRIVSEENQKELIFDAVVDSSIKLSREGEITLKRNICENVKQMNPLYTCNITLDKDFQHL